MSNNNLNAFYKFYTNPKYKHRGLSIQFFQESESPLQIVRKCDSLSLLVKPDKLEIKIINNTYNYIGLSITLGFYNLIQDGSLIPSKAYDESLFELKPKESKIINTRSENQLTKQNLTKLVLNNSHIGTHLKISQKKGNPVYVDNGYYDQVQWVEYYKKATDIFFAKLELSD
jgi:hypothetical protein